MKDIKGWGKLSSNDTLFDDRWLNGVKTEEEKNSEVIDYCGPVKTSHKGFFPDKLKNSRNSVQESFILLWIVLQELLVVDHSWTLYKSKYIRRYLGLLLQRGQKY